MPDDPRPTDADRPDDRPAGGTPIEDVRATPATAPAPAVPDEAELARVAVPATVRRAPRYRAFLVTGALVGMVVGLVLALLTAGDSGLTGTDGGVLPFLGGQSGVRWLLALGGGLVGGFAGGAVALVADRRSTRRSSTAPHD